MNTSNNIALGFVSNRNLPFFYEGASQTKNIDDATAPSLWAREDLQTFNKITDIADLLSKKVQDVTNNPDAKVAIVVDQEFLTQSQFPAATANEFLDKLRGAFSGSLQTVLIGTEKEELATFTQALEEIFKE